MDRVRGGVDGLTRQLRNMASPTPEQPQAIDLRHGPRRHLPDRRPRRPERRHRLNANTSNVKRVRYCLDDTKARLWRQNQRWLQRRARRRPSTTACPGPSAPSARELERQEVLADQVTNYATGHARPLFTFGPAASPLTGITSVHTDLYVDLDTSNAPDETALSSGVYLRNQNQQPTARLIPDQERAGDRPQRLELQRPRGRAAHLLLVRPVGADRVQPAGAVRRRPADRHRRHRHRRRAGQREPHRLARGPRPRPAVVRPPASSRCSN